MPSVQIVQAQPDGYQLQQLELADGASVADALAQAGHAPESVDTRAEVDLTLDGGPTISAIRLETRAKVPGIEESRFRAIADDAKQNCPVSKALSAVPITLKAELLG